MEFLSDPAASMLDALRGPLGLTGTKEGCGTDCKLVRTARETPTFVIATGTPDPALTDAGVRVLTVEAVGQDRPDLKSVARILAAEGLTDLFVEGGGQVAGSFLRCGLVDAIEWFRAPIVLGGEGRPGVGALAVASLAAAPHFRRVEVSVLGDDLWERYAKA
ncbi:MAG: dihydrofolate reductase family protein [Phenylobacterium sp.]|nr:dihydrofolate reductase family protein [Phenylobacterium sp.]